MIGEGVGLGGFCILDWRMYRDRHLISGSVSRERERERERGALYKAVIVRVLG